MKKNNNEEETTMSSRLLGNMMDTSRSGAAASTSNSAKSLSAQDVNTKSCLEQLEEGTCEKENSMLNILCFVVYFR